MKKAIFAGALLLALTITAFGQTADQPRPDRWRGLIIDESSPEDAIRILGKPDKDEMGKLKFPPLKDQLSEKRKQKVFRNLLFNEVEGFDRAKIIFYQGKLVGIALDFKEKPQPAALLNAYPNVRFGPVVDTISEVLAPRGTMQRDQGNLYINRYPSYYYIIGFSENTIVAAWISKNFGTSLLQDTFGANDRPGTYPGRAEQLILLSRTLENRDKVDLLK